MLEKCAMPEKTLSELRRFALKLGIQEARIISARTVKTAAWVRFKCQFGCSGFGECLSCPPYSPTPYETRLMIKEYSKAILLHKTGGSKVSVSGVVYKLEREAFLSGYYKAFGMGAGPCMLCRICDLKKGCRHAEEARPAMEACGIDVFATARANGFPIETVTSTQCRANYYGIVFLT